MTMLRRTASSLPGRISLSFASLGSGSRGNATVVRKNGTCLLVDCGFSMTQVQKRLGGLGLSPEDLTAILVTHEHGDHIRGVAPLARKSGIPVWMTPGTAASYPESRDIPRLNMLNCHRPLEIGDIQVQPYPVPHDAREPCQFVFTDGARRLGLLTDTGSPTHHIHSQLDGCDALMIESNHDEVMLANSAYPESVKARIGGQYGHLSNRQAAALLGQVDCSRLQHLVAAHLSERNNTVSCARHALSNALGCAPRWVAVADQDRGLDWRHIT